MRGSFMTWLLKPVSFYSHFNQALFQRTIWAPPHTRVHQIPTHITIHIDYGSFTITHTQIQYISKRESSDQSIHSQQSGNLKRYHSNEKWPQSLSGRCWWCSFNDVVLVGFVPSYVCVCVCVSARAGTHTVASELEWRSVLKQRLDGLGIWASH